MFTEILTATVALTALGLMVLAFALLRVKRNYRCLLEEFKLTQQSLRQMEQQLGAWCSASAGAGDHVVRLQQQVQRIVERQNLLELRAGRDRPYTQASQLVHKGADIEELVDTCGLTRGEAELLVMMQRGAA